MTIPTDDVFFSKTERGKPDVEFLKDHFYLEGRIKEEHALYIIDKATQLLRAEPNVLTIPGRDGDPVIVCGNTHGQYHDLMTLFEVGSHPPKARYLFLGGYINRGHFSIECLLYLWTLKIWYPNSFFLLRGSHECRLLSEHYTFEIECKHKYSERIYEACLKSFHTLPLVAIIADRYFCVHGGISPYLHTIDDIGKLNRFCEPPKSGLMCDILWSDPIEDFGQERTTEDFVYNNARGVSYFYTYKAVCNFLERNRFESIIRTHQGFDAGYCEYRKHHGNSSVITVFSAPNYDGIKNSAAVLRCYVKGYIVQQFKWHRLLKDMDAFSWSLPFICEKVMDMLAVLLYIYFLELNESIQNSTLSVAPVGRDKVELLAMLQNKIRAVRCISYMFSVFRCSVGSEHMSELKNFLRSYNRTLGVLSLRAEDIKNAIKSFNEARISDEDNERLPPIKRQLTSAPRPLPLPNTAGSAGERVASASATVGATPMTPFRRTKEGGESEVKKLNTEVEDREMEVHSRKEAASQREVIRRPEKARLSLEHFEASIRHAETSPKIPGGLLDITETSHQQDEPSDTSHYETEPWTYRAMAEIQDIEKQLREKERHLQIREAEVQDVERVLRVKERDLQIREAEVQKMLQAVNERREAVDLQEDNLRQRLAAMKKLEENPSPRLREAALTQQMTIAWHRNGAALESDFSLSSISTIRNSPRVHTNVDLFPERNAKLNQDSEYHGNELASLASTTSLRSGPSKRTNIGLSSSKSHARLKEDSEYYGNE